jgi:CheY-like chemotaxis protein
MMDNDRDIVGRPLITEKAARTVLIVDDEVDVVEVFTMLFQVHGFDVVSAGNGLAALDTLHESLPDIVLSDCMMPVMDGIELCRRLKQAPATAAIPIILMSAAPGNHDLTSAPYDLFMKKPFLFSTLLFEVEKLLPPASGN